MTMVSRAAAGCFLFLAACGGRVVVSSGGGGGGGQSSTTVTSAAGTSHTAGTSGTSTGGTASTSSGPAPTCPKPDVIVRWDALNGPTDACAAVNALTPTNYKATDISHYQEVFLKLRDHQPVRVEFYFETAFNSATGYIVIAPGGTANATVAEWTSCDMAPLDVHTANRVLPDPMTLTSCAYATTVSDQIGCVRSAFGGASSGPPTCTVPSNNGGPP